MYFDGNDKDDVIKKIKRSKQTNLKSFFELCQTNHYATILLYKEIPQYYIWQCTPISWKRMTRKLTEDNISDTIGRLFSIHPTQIELFAVWQLLNYVKGSTSSKNLRTVDY